MLKRSVKPAPREPSTPMDWDSSRINRYLNLRLSSIYTLDCKPFLIDLVQSFLRHTYNLGERSNVTVVGKQAFSNNEPTCQFSLMLYKSVKISYLLFQSFFFNNVWYLPPCHLLGYRPRHVPSLPCHCAWTSEHWSVIFVHLFGLQSWHHRRCVAQKSVRCTPMQL